MKYLYLIIVAIVLIGCSKEEERSSLAPNTNDICQYIDIQWDGRTQDHIRVEFTEGIYTMVSIFIKDIHGTNMDSLKVGRGYKFVAESWDIRGLGNGVFYFHINTDQGQCIKSLVITKQ